jgi:hypothetical protein
MNWAKTILQMQQEGFFVPKMHVANDASDEHHVRFFGILQ